MRSIYLHLCLLFSVALFIGCGNGTSSNSSTPQSGTLAFTTNTAAAAQAAGTIVLTVSRTAGSDTAVSVHYATADGTAVAGAQYTATSGTLSWAAGDAASKTITVPLITTSSYSSPLTFTVTLSAAAGGATLGTTVTNTVTITPTPPVGTLALSASTVSVNEAAGTIALTVNRTAGSNGAVGVSYATSNGTATAGTHYTSTSGLLTWTGGDATAKTINVPISSTYVFNGSLTFTATLSAPTGGATLGSPSSEVVTIIATPVPGTLALSASTVSVAQSAGTIALTVNRTAGSNGAVGISYATSNGTGTAGTNYTNTSSTLSWTDGDSAAKTITVPLSTTSVFSGSLTFTVTLSAPTGSATLGSTSAETVTINTAGPYSAFTQYFTLPYTGSPVLKSLGSSLLHVSASIAADTAHTGTTASYILDTGSTGVVMPASELTGHTACTGSDPAGQITYSSSGLQLTGCWVSAVITFYNATNQAGASAAVTATLPVLAVVTGSCTGSGVNSANCTGGIPHMMGIGFGRGTGTYDSPAYNPMVNIAQMAAGTMRRGYIFTSAGLQVGLTNATVPLASPLGGAITNLYVTEQLTASGAFPGIAYDWNIAPGSFIYAGTQTANGTVLFDTGLTNMILEDTSHASGTVVASGTAITINAIPGSGSTPLASYTFTSGDGGNATPSSISWASYTHGTFVNVGNHFLGKFDYLYDADGGILGLRPVAR